MSDIREDRESSAAMIQEDGLKAGSARQVSKLVYPERGVTKRMTFTDC
jgi:hypothetical protein